VAFDIENFPESESAKRMLGCVTRGFYDKSYVAKWMFEVMGREYDTARELIEDLPKQFFPETATWGLAYHEIKWGLPVMRYLTYEERRKIIYQKRDFKAPMTPYRMETYLSAITGFKVTVADAHDPGEFNFHPPHPNVFQVTFVGEGRLDVKEAYKAVEEIKQSHTTFRIDEVVLVEFDFKWIEKIHFDSLVMRLGVNNQNLIAQMGDMRFGVKNNNTIESSVRTRRNVWRLNGKVRLNGTRKLNALDKEESLDG